MDTATQKNVTREKAKKTIWRCTSKHRKCLATLKKKIDEVYTPGKRKHKCVPDKSKIEYFPVILVILDQLERY